MSKKILDSSLGDYLEFFFIDVELRRDYSPGRQVRREERSRKYIFEKAPHI